MYKDIIGPGNKEALTYDASGNPINSLGGALNGHDADVHTRKFNHFLVNKPGVDTTLDGQALKNTYIFDVISVVGLAEGDHLDMRFGSVHIHHYRTITDITGNSITVDSRLDQDFPDGSDIQKGVFNMIVNGTKADPIIYSVFPAAGEILHLRGMLISFTHKSAATDVLFGSLAALTEGIQLRENYGNGDSYKTLSNWKANRNLKEDMFDVDYTDKAGPSLFGTNGRWTLWQRMGIIRLVGDDGDQFEALVQETLTTASELTDLQINVQGHFEGQI